MDSQQGISGLDFKYGIPFSLLRAVGLVLQFLAMRAGVQDPQLKWWFEQHTLALFLPLRTLLPKFGALDRPLDGSLSSELLWDILNDHLRYGTPVETLHGPGLTVCPMCKTQIASAAHFEETQHRRNFMLQLFRFGPVGLCIEEHQRWMLDNRLKIPRRYRGSRGNITVWFEKVIGVGAYGKAYRSTDWRIGPPGVTIIGGSSPAGLPVQFVFRVQNNSPVRPTILIPLLSDFMKHSGWRIAIRRMLGHGREEIFVISLPSTADIGIKYYEIQIWVSYVNDAGVQKFMPISAILQWRHINEAIYQEAHRALQQAPEKTKRTNDKRGTARKPNSDFQPPRGDTDDGNQMKRILKPTRMWDAALTPYYLVWPHISREVPTNSVRSIRFGGSPHDLIDENDHEAIASRLNWRQGIDYPRFAPRLLAEVVGQLEYEEDDPSNAPIYQLRESLVADFDSAAMSHCTLGPSVLSQDNDAFYMTGILESRRYDYLGLRIGQNARLIHRSWPYKHLTQITGEELCPEGKVKLIFRLNNGVKREFLHPSSSLEGLILCAPMSPAPEFVISLLKVQIYGERSEDEQEDSKNNGKTHEEEVGQPSCSSSNPFPQPDEISLHAISPEDSNRMRMKQLLRGGFDAFFQHLFHQTTAPPISPNWEKSTALMSSLDWSNDEQREMVDAVLSGKRVVLCKAPPGTGKTTCVAAMVAAFSIANPGKKFLCLTSTNVAANILTERLVKAYAHISGEPVPPQTILRYLRRGYDIGSLEEEVQSVAATRTDPDDNSVQTVNSTSAILRHKIILCTLDMAAMDIVNCLEAFSSGSEDDGRSVFDVIVIDEAASVDLPRMATVLSLAGFSQTVLLGDVYQLPAYITNQVLKRHGAEESGMEFLLRLGADDSSTAIVQLRVNYRSRPPLLRPPNAIIYGETPLVAAADDTVCRVPDEEYAFIPSWSPIVFRHVESRHEYHGVSLYNVDEASAVKHVTQDLLDFKCANQSQIGILTAYAAQADVLNYIVGTLYPEIRIRCGNSWQGDQRDYIIISLVRSWPPDDAYGQTHDLGFLADNRRMNVSITRARRMNIFVCNVLHFLDQPLIKESLRECCKAQSWMEPMSPAVKYFVHLRVCVAHNDEQDSEDVSKSVAHCQDLVEGTW